MSEPNDFYEDDEPLAKVLAAFHGVTFPIPPPDDPVNEPRPQQEHWVCDGCMNPVTRKQIADMCDGEHVICRACIRREYDR